ncbi:MAG: M48 family metallopeptidase [Candidatus Binatia bacterium]
MQIHWEGYYLDGRTAVRHKAVILLTPTALEITTEGGERLWWPYHEIRQTQGFYAGEQVRLERGGEILEALLVSDTAFLTSLHSLSPELATHFHHPSRRVIRAKLTFLAALAVVAITAALYLWGIPAMAALVASRVPVSWEEHLGQALLEHLAPQEEWCTEQGRVQAIDQIMTTLTKPLSNSPYKFKVIVLNNPMVNAFAAPGGHIVIFRGLIERTQNAEELAGVLAHELQHVLQRHATRALLQHASTGLLVAAVSGDVSGVMAFGLESARTLGALRYSRQNEEEADREGMQMLIRAGIDPAGIISIFELFKQEGGKLPALLAYLSTHPSTERRIDKLKLLAAESQRKPVKLLKDYDWDDMKKICSSTTG